MSNCTCIIPIKIDSDVRHSNVLITLNYILKHTDYQIIVTEADEQQKLFVEQLDLKRIKYNFQKTDGKKFHRTKLINEMLNSVETEITINYDADVLLSKEGYEQAENMIVKNGCDVVYPYGFEQFDQRKIFTFTTEAKKFKDTLDLNDYDPSNSIVGFCRYGHIQYFKTEVYKKGFMENETYKHWCPEDEERGIRFKKLGFNVCWFRNIVFHQEHPPSTLEAPLNKDEIYKLHESIINMTKDELIEYYSKQEYLKNYKR